MSVLNLEASTVNTIWDWDFLTCQDSLFKTVKSFLTVETTIYLSRGRFKKQDFSINIWLRWDFYQDFLRKLVLKSLSKLRNLD
jgi:hypothetical protein